MGRQITWDEDQLRVARVIENVIPAIRVARRLQGVIDVIDTAIGSIRRRRAKVIVDKKTERAPDETSVFVFNRAA